MNSCPYCDNQIKDHWLYCHHCNKPLISNLENKENLSQASIQTSHDFQEEYSYLYPNLKEERYAPALDDAINDKNFEVELEKIEKLIEERTSTGESHGDLLLKKASLYYQKRDFSTSIKILEIALENFTLDNDLLNVAISHNEMGLIQEEMGYFDNSIYQFERAIEILVELEDNKKLLQVFNNLANVYFILKDLEKSYEYYQKAISIAKQEKLFLEEIKTSSNLVDVLFFLKNYERIKDILRQNAVYFRQAGDIFGIITTLTKYGKLYYHLGEEHYTKSKQSFENALELLSKIAGQIPYYVKAQMEWECFLYLGIYEKSLQHDDLAEDLLLKSLESIRTFEIGDSINQAIVLKHLGLLYKNKGEFKLAIEYLTLSGDIYYKFGEDFQQAELKTQIGQIYLDQLNDDMEAVKFLEEALEIFENRNFEKQCAEILHKLGDISINKGMIDMAISNFERAKFLYDEIKDHYNANLLNEKLNSLTDFHEKNDFDL